MRFLSRSVCGAAAAVFGAALVFGLGNDAAAQKQTAKKAAAPAPDGRELFTREWIPGDQRSHGGDGLGPLFNESSCVACHNQGAVGGAGPDSKNVQILTAFRNVMHQQAVPQVRSRPQTLPEQIFQSFFGRLDEPAANAPSAFSRPPQPTAVDIAAFPGFTPAQLVAPQAAAPQRIATRSDAPPQPAIPPQPVAPQPFAAQAATTPQPLATFAPAADRKEIARLHPGLEASPSVVLHRSATYAEYEPWRRQLGGLGHIGMVQISSGEVTMFAEAALEEARPDAPAGFAVQHQQPQHLIQQLKQEAQTAAQRRQFSQASQHGNFAVLRSERNTTALFGAGLIDAVPVAALEALEKRQSEQGEVSGRVSRQKDGKAGRFGWKAQTPSLHDFVLIACAAELGLNVPGHSQAGIPHKLDYRPTGLDMTDEECNALVDFVRDLPAPQQRPLADDTDKAFVHAGRKLFDNVGCAACHVSDVADAKNIFSDLLLHDMGPDLGDSGSSYGIFVPDSTPDGTPAPQQLAAAPGVTGTLPQTIGATRQEWRTAPLWGVRDSAPYLHDGRAETLEQAIAFHGGESQQSAQRYFQLSADERFQVITFLKSLVAPGTAVATR